MKSPLSQPPLATQMAKETEEEMVGFLCLRGKKFHFRRRVPGDIKKYFPPNYGEISRSLDTSIKSVANVAVRAWVVKTDSVFTFLRSDVDDEDKIRFLAKQIPLNETPASTKDTVRVSDLITQYVEYKTPSWKLKTRQEVENSLNLFIKCCGDTYLRAMDFKSIEIYRNKLSQLPPGITVSKKYKNLTIEEILSIPIDQKEVLDPRSINKHLGFFSTLMRFGFRRDLVRVNFAEGIRVKEIDGKLAEKDKEEYSKDDIQHIINSLHWDSENPARMFVTLLLIFTGARRNEMCQLYTSDIEVLNGIPCVLINGNGDKITYIANTGKMKGIPQLVSEKVCKKSASWRFVPIHPTLWYDLGFAGYVDLCRKSGQKRLFPELSFHRDGYGLFFSKWFDPQIAHVIAPPNSKKSLHSLRHSFQNWFKQHQLQGMERGFANEVLNEVIGHAYNVNKKEVLSKERYGKKYPASTTIQLVCQLDYELDFSPITEQVGIAQLIKNGGKAISESKRHPQMEYPTEDNNEQ